MEKHWRIDKNGYFTENEDTHDWLEVQYMAYIAYKDASHIKAIVKCYQNEFSKYIPTRYPVYLHTDKPVSRDHVVYSMIALKEYYQNKALLRHFKQLICMSNTNGLKMNLELKLWLNMITGANKYGWLIYTLIYSIINRYWNKFIFSITHQNEEIGGVNITLPKVMKRRYNPLGQIVFPMYAIKIIATQIYHSDKNWFTKQISKNYLKIVPKGNLAIRKLFGDYVSQQEIDNYIPMATARWAVILNPYINPNTMQYLTIDEYDKALDKDYLKAL